MIIRSVRVGNIIVDNNKEYEVIKALGSVIPDGKISNELGAYRFEVKDKFGKITKVTYDITDTNIKII